MAEIIRRQIKTGIICAALLSLMIFDLAGCTTSKKIFTIGILVSVSSHSPAIEGFKNGLSELGYVEGTDVKYIYYGIVENNPETIDAEINRLISQDIDILLSLGNESALRARKATEGTGIPVLFTLVSRPVEYGLVKSLRQPGGNATGVTNIDSSTKALEFLKIIIPGLKKVYLPYNPDDDISLISITDADKAASQLGIELILQEVHSVEEAVECIKNLPKDVDAIFRVPSPTLDGKNSELSQAAIARGLPMASRVPLDKAVLMTYSDDPYIIGKQTARLAHELEQGIKPADLPVENSETFLTINLDTAGKIGLNIPDNILSQARIIIR